MNSKVSVIGFGLILFLVSGCGEEKSKSRGPSPSGSPFAGIAACRECHADRVAEYMRTPHFRTLRNPESTRPEAPFNNEEATLETRNPDLRFHMSEVDGEFHVTARQTGKSGNRTIDQRVDLIIGSGRIFEGYLSFDDDALFQIPVGYFAAGERWANCPGYEDGTADFSRPILPRCIDCHGTWAKVKPEGGNHYVPDSIEPGISCERCHGNAKEHIAWHRDHPDSDEGQKIIKPADLSSQRRLELCGQCHGDPGTLLAPAFSYVPGTPLENYVKQDKSHGDTSFVHTANQVQRLVASSCFQQSGDIDCTDCHNPHRFDPAALRESTLKACARCHKETDCAHADQIHKDLRPQCISCHMPSRSAILTTISEREDDFQDVVQLLDHTIGVHSLESDAIELRFLQKRKDPKATPLRERVILSYRQRYKAELTAGRLVEAASYARKLVELEAKDAHSLLATARAMQAFRRRIDALIQTAMATEGEARRQQLDQVIQIHLSNPAAASERALVSIAAHLLDSGRPKEALSVCNRAGRSQKNLAADVKLELLAHKGAAQLALGNAAAAIRTLQDVLELSPNHNTAPQDLARAYLSTRQPDDALQVIVRQLDLTPESTRWLNLRAEAEMQSGKQRESIETLYRSLSLDDRQTHVHFALGRYLASQNQVEQAREHLEICLKLARATGANDIAHRAAQILEKL